MNASSTPTTPPTALEMLTARGRVGAALYAAGEIPNLQNVVDALEKHAERYGLVARHEQDVVQAIMSEAFRRVRAGEMPP
jgi:glycine/D-amino acid oxidase-like deaminating enzyme